MEVVNLKSDEYMGKTYRVKGPSEALELALQFQKTKKYDLFRGQNKDWSLTTSSGRLSPDKIEENGERLCWLFEFLYQYEQTKHYTENIDDFFAIAQHYGLPTDLIDFTQSPEVALFFATHSKQSLAGTEGVIICLNKKDFNDCITFCDAYFKRREISPPRIFESCIDNLWRLKAQKGCFMQSHIFGLETLYPFDKIIFPHSDDWHSIDESEIYPEKKSDLEILLDNHFAAERINEGAHRLQHFADELGIPIQRIKSEPDYKYVKSSIPHQSWNETNMKKWAYKVSEPLRKKPDIEFEIAVKSIGSFQKNFLQIKEQCASLFQVKGITRRDFISPTVVFVPKIRSKRLSLRINNGVKNIWDGMRTLPYTKPQIINAIAKYLVLELYNSAKKVDIESCYFSPILIEMSNHIGAHCRFYASEYLVENAFRDDILEIPDDSLPRSLGSQLLLYVQKVKVVFDFNKLTSLFAKEIIPSMMVRSNSDRPVLIFSPVYLDRLGYA